MASDLRGRPQNEEGSAPTVDSGEDSSTVLPLLLILLALFLSPLLYDLLQWLRVAAN